MAVEGPTFPLAIQMTTEESLVGTEKDQSTASTATLKIVKPTWLRSPFLVSQLCPDLWAVLAVLNTFPQYIVSIDLGKSDSDQLLHLQRVSGLENQA